MAAMQLVGKKNLNWMCGMLTIDRWGLILRFCG